MFVTLQDKPLLVIYGDWWVDEGGNPWRDPIFQFCWRAENLVPVLWFRPQLVVLGWKINSEVLRWREEPTLHHESKLFPMKFQRSDRFCSNMIRSKGARRNVLDNLIHCGWIKTGLVIIFRHNYSSRAFEALDFVDDLTNNITDIKPNEPFGMIVNYRSHPQHNFYVCWFPFGALSDK